MKKPLIILSGPTAAGKSKLSIALAKTLNGAIISADSVQVYRGMDIGSAKIMPEEMDGIKHYMIDVLEPDEEFHVYRFYEMVKECMDEIYANNQIPILVGGTGFYIQAILYDIDFNQDSGDKTYRAYLETLVNEKGVQYLHNMLNEVDPQSAKIIHMNNVKRVIRALEYYHETGEMISKHNESERQKESPYNFAYFVLTDERELLYERINKRVDKMVEEGLVEEVKSLHERGYTKDLVSMQALGYKEILDFLNGDIDLDRALYLIKRDTRHFAKRQLTWFAREKDVIWINRSDYNQDEHKILEFMLEEWKKRGN